MNFKKHSSNLVGTHALFGASSPAWVNYDEERLARFLTTAHAARRGTELHELAKNLIRLRVRLPDVPVTMNQYVNDAIGFNMTPEQLLYFSPNFYGTTDAISYRSGMLRIHDLKTGINKTSIVQLEIYAALFCHEYEVKPHDIEMEFRIYQNDEVHCFADIDPHSIAWIMDRMVFISERIEALQQD